MEKLFFIYIMTNQYNTTLYTGVTNDLKRRVMEHKQDVVEGFTKRYKLHKLVYYEVTDSINTALAREKQIKAGSRQHKKDLVNGMNKEWKDLADELF
jgi:putative endonuclease